DASERHGRVGGTEVPADREVDVVRADAEVEFARPELERTRIEVEERGAPEAGTQRRRHAVREIQEERVFRSRFQLVHRETVVFDSPWRIVAVVVGED